MAFSSSVVKHDIFGTTQVKIINCDFAAVTAGHIKTGFGNVFAAHVNNEVTEGDGKAAINKASDGSAAEAGSVNLTGFTANDVATITVFGN